jgi:hypothetical protein
VGARKEITRVIQRHQDDDASAQKIDRIQSRAKGRGRRGFERLRITGHARTDSKTGGNRTSILVGGFLNRM